MSPHNKVILKGMSVLALMFILFEVFVFLINQKNTYLNLVAVLWLFAMGLTIYNLVYSMINVPAIADNTNTTHKENTTNETA